MFSLTQQSIEKDLADSRLIFSRGEALYQNGSYFLSEADLEKNRFVYQVDGSFGDYTTWIRITPSGPVTGCNCPYPGDGCKHVVAAALNARDVLLKKGMKETPTALPSEADPYLSSDEIRKQALADREKRSKSESFELVRGDMVKGDHLVINQYHKQYRVTLHVPKAGQGHCNCPDYMTNGFGTCKHLLFLTRTLKKDPQFSRSTAAETFPFIDIFWDSGTGAPRLFAEDLSREPEEVTALLNRYFHPDGSFRLEDVTRIMDPLEELAASKRVLVRESLIRRIEHQVLKAEMGRMAAVPLPEIPLNVELYPYQKKGVAFGLYKPGVLIGDEMGLGKTLQAIALGILKKELFGVQKIIVVTLASLKEQWKREIERFSNEKAVIVEGSPDQRRTTYFKDESLFKITNYEAVLRDVLMLSRYKPDLIILDEAQRIKNFSTKTADAVKRIPKKHAIVLTGTPLENKLEDVYSIAQFLDPYMLTPLWRFAGDHFLIPRNKKSSVAGYRNLDRLNEKLKSIVIRRKKETVLKELPRQVVNNYYVDLTQEQQEMHNGYLGALAPLLNKKFLTPVDVRRIQMLMLKMRQVCNTTFLIDRETHISPKLKELEGIIDEMVVQNQRKMVIFSEWTTMNFIIARTLSDMDLPFVELSGKVPVKKRQALIDEFTRNPECRVFLSTDAGGTGLNLQAADCVVNFELPWNPARLNQRIGRVNRIGQASNCINVINLIAKNSIEERILAGIQLKTDLFKGVFDDGPDTVEFSREKRNEMLNRLRAMMGEEALPPVSETVDPEEIPEDTPHYLNPEVMAREEADEDSHAPTPETPEKRVFAAAGIPAREGVLPGFEDPDGMPAGDLHRQDATAASSPAASASTPADMVAAGPQPGVSGTSDSPTADLSNTEGTPRSSGGDILSAQPPEKIETVLNSGMQFMAGLMEMATGQKMEATGDTGKMIEINRDTGEVTMKFKLPGF